GSMFAGAAPDNSWALAFARAEQKGAGALHSNGLAFRSRFRRNRRRELPNMGDAFHRNAAGLAALLGRRGEGVREAGFLRLLESQTGPPTRAPFPGEGDFADPAGVLGRGRVGERGNKRGGDGGVGGGLGDTEPPGDGEIDVAPA